MSIGHFNRPCSLYSPTTKKTKEWTTFGATFSPLAFVLPPANTPRADSSCPPLPSIRLPFHPRLAPLPSPPRSTSILAPRSPGRPCSHPRSRPGRADLRQVARIWRLLQSRTPDRGQDARIHVRLGSCH